MVKSAIRPLLLLATVIAGGCAPPLSLVDRPCPCGTGFTCCAASNVCVRDGDACGGPATNAPMAYVLTPMVRQGGTLLVTLTGSDGTAPTTNRNNFTVSMHPDAPSSYDVTIPHGAPLGDVDVRFTAKGGVSTQTRAVFTVTEITVSPTGSDAGHGTRADPFRTLKKAISVADSGDIIQLLNDPVGYSVFTGEDRESSLPRKVTLRGESPTDTRLITLLMFSGDAEIKNLKFEWRAFVTEPGSVVKFDNVVSLSGLVVKSTAARARIELTGGSALRSGEFPALFVQAPDVTIKMSGGTSIDKGGENGGEAVRLEGAAPIVDVSGGSISSTGSNALVDLGGGTFTVKQWEVYGALNFAHPEGVATIEATTFRRSGTNGRAGIAFSGRSLSVQESTFVEMGITQDSPDGKVVVHGCRFTQFTEPAYVLTAGSLDLGNQQEPGYNMFIGLPSRAGIVPPALSVLAKPGMAWATSRATSLNGLVPHPAAVMGPAKTPEYEISDKVPVNFY